MNRIAVCLLGTFILVSAGLVSCSKESKPQPAQQTATRSPAASPPAEPAPSVTPASTATQAAVPTASAEKPSGARASEKHTLSVTNYAKTSVTVTINGVWVGQWDSHTNVPLDSVIQGKNQMAVELQDEPKNELRIEVDTERDGKQVNLLRLNFQGKSAGTYTYNFVAK